VQNLAPLPGEQSGDDGGRRHERRRTADVPGGYWTARTLRIEGPVREHARNGNGMTFDAVWLGG
jgi:hypothetical protein